MWVERIDPIDWTFHLVSDEELDGKYGECSWEDAAIRVRASLSGIQRAATEWHEHIHAILYVCGYSKHDERMVDAMAHVIAGWAGAPPTPTLASFRRRTALGPCAKASRLPVRYR